MLLANKNWNQFISVHEEWVYIFIYEKIKNRLMKIQSTGCPKSELIQEKIDYFRYGSNKRADFFQWSRRVIRYLFCFIPLVCFYFEWWERKKRSEECKQREWKENRNRKRECERRTERKKTLTAEAMWRYVSNMPITYLPTKEKMCVHTHSMIWAEKKTWQNGHE
jgi:hypothetical protein